MIILLHIAKKKLKYIFKLLKNFQIITKIFINKFTMYVQNKYENLIYGTYFEILILIAFKLFNRNKLIFLVELKMIHSRSKLI